MEKLKRLDGKVAIVTGSSSGIGKAVAIRFAEEGARVIIAARRVSLCSQVAGLINERGGKALSIPTDIRDEGQVEHLISQTAEQCGGWIFWSTMLGFLVVDRLQIRARNNLMTS